MIGWRKLQSDQSFCATELRGFNELALPNYSLWVVSWLSNKLHWTESKRSLKLHRLDLNDSVLCAEWTKTDKVVRLIATDLNADFYPYLGSLKSSMPRGAIVNFWWESCGVKVTTVLLSHSGWPLRHNAKTVQSTNVYVCVRRKKLLRGNLLFTPTPPFPSPTTNTTASFHLSDSQRLLWDGANSQNWEKLRGRRDTEGQKDGTSEGGREV